MKSITKTLVGTAAAGVLAVGSATPALANDRDRGIAGGDILIGALILGGIAAVAAIADDDDRHDRRYRDLDYRHNDRYDRYDRYDRRGYGSSRHNGDAAVNQCIRAVERTAERYGGGRAEVTQVRDVDRERRGWEVKGRLAVQDYRHNGRRHDRNRGWDEGRFTCDIRNGRVVDIDYSGIRGL